MKLTNDDLTQIEEITVGGRKCHVGVVAAGGRRPRDVRVAFWTDRDLEIHAFYGAGPSAEHAIADLIRLGAEDERARFKALAGPDEDKKRAAVQAAAQIISRLDGAWGEPGENALSDLYDIAYGQGGQ